MEIKINRIKVMLAEKGKTNKMTIRAGGERPSYSKWCNLLR